MSDDRVGGLVNEGIGRVQDAAGGLVGDKETQAKGKLNEVACSVQNAYGQVKNRGQDALEQAKDNAQNAYGGLESYVRNQPIPAMAIGVGVGLLLSRRVGSRRTNVMEKAMPTKADASGASDALPAAIDVVGELGAAGREVVSEVVGEFSNAALKFFDDRKSSAAKTVHGVATIFQRAAADLTEESPPLAKYAERSGKALNVFSQRLRDRRWGDLVGQAGQLREKRPAAFFLICAGLGVAAGALLMSSARSSGALAHAVDNG
jgi:uncharacterized protein YjbJ (UPF0337 family)